MNAHELAVTAPHPQLIEALAGAPFAVLLVDAQGTIIYANPPLLALFGYAADALLYQALEILLPEGERAGHALRREGQSSHYRTHAMSSGLRIVGRHRDGREIALQVRLQSSESEAGRYTLAFVNELPPEQSDHLELERLNRTLRLVHDCNGILVRARSEETLLAGIAQCMANIGHYPQVWIGLLPFADGSFRTSMSAGQRRACGSSPGVTGVEVIARRAIVNRVPLMLSAEELQAQAPLFCPRLGGEPVSTLIALPLQSADTVHGCLCVASNVDNSFLANEISLLQELADDLAFGLDALHDRHLRRNAEARLRLLESAVEASANAIIISDALAPEHPILYANPAFERMTGYPASEAIGRNGRFLLGEDRAQSALEVIRAAWHGQHSAKALLRNYRKDGSLFWNELTVAPVRDEAGKVTHFVSVMNDFTARKLQDEQIERHALYDTLTGLPNRYSLFEHIRQLADAAKHGSHVICVALIALDRFSLINDAYGHDAGDALLRAVASRLLGTLRGRDTVARLGGDEFVVVLSRLAPDDAITAIDKIRQTLARPFELTCGEVMISASIGVSFSPRDGDDAQSLVRNAEVAMQGAKTAGWNAVRFYAEDMNRRTGERLAMEFDLRRALEKNEFEIYYQPIIDIASGRIVEAEALLRWNRPQHGRVAPDNFIPLAETSGLIVPIGEWVLHEACRQNARWRAAGLPPISIAVNLSARQFREPGLETLVADALAAHALDGRTLALEVTESLLMVDIVSAGETLLHLKQLGVHISLDDFGTGYSSLAYLQRLPLDTLKIDRSFVCDIVTDPNDAAIAATIISMARSMHLGVIAEGVETPEQLAHLCANGCQRAQGYLFSPPLAAACFEQLLLAQGALPS